MPGPKTIASAAVAVAAICIASLVAGSGPAIGESQTSPAPELALPLDEPVPIRMINGLETVRLDETHVAIFRGSAADNAALALIQVEDKITLDILKVGPGGRDNLATEADRGNAELASRLLASASLPGGFAAAEADDSTPDGRPLPGWYMPVLVDDPFDQQPPTAILTRHVSSMRTGTPINAFVDPRFILRRSLPSAFYYDGQHGFRPMICHGHPQPFCLWTHQGRTKEELTIFEGDLVEGANQIDAGNFVPQTGRILRMALVLENRGVEPAIVGVKPSASAGVSIPAAIVPAGASVVVAEVETTTTSAEKFVIETSQPLRARVHALGFSILQPL